MAKKASPASGGAGEAIATKQKLPQTTAMQTTQFCYPYAYGMMESILRGLAANMATHGVITHDQAEEIQVFVDNYIDLVRKKTEEFGKQKLK